MRFLRYLRGSALSLALMVNCSGLETPPPFAGAELRVLFIGNSLTYANDLPAMTAQLAGSADVPPMRVVTLLRGNYALEDHWNEGEASRMIAEGNWDVIVLQQGPSALPESQANLLEYTRRFASLAQSIDARVALYMAWPPADRDAARDSVRTSYTNAAAAVGGILVPAGEAWRAAWRRDPSLALYGNDGFHPTRMGSYLAALCLFEQLYGKSPIGLPAAGVDERKVPLLQQAAADADARYGQR
jgi:hypothetical protein